MQMHLTALNAKSEPETELAAEFARLFSGEPVEAIEFAFCKWRETSQFFPAISDLRVLIKRWRTERREGEKHEVEQAEKAAIERARREGKLVSFAECMQKLREQLKSIQEPEHERRERAFRLRVRSRRQQMQHAADAIPTLQLSESEIRARRQIERAEIDRYNDAQSYREEQGFA